MTENEKFLDNLDDSESDPEKEESSIEDQIEDDFDPNNPDDVAKKLASMPKMPARLLRGARQSKMKGHSEYEKIRESNIIERKAMLATLRADFSKFKKDSGIGAKKRKREDSDEDEDWHPTWQHKSKPKPQKCSECPSMVRYIDMHMKDCHTGELQTCTKCSYNTR